MPVLSTELKVYKSVEMNDTTTNGGYMSANLSVTGVRNNIFPDAPDMERQAGSTKYRKVFWKIENDDDLLFNLSKIYMSSYTVGADYITMFAGTQRDVQSDITGSERQYGAAPLTNDISATAQSLIITLEDASLDIFQNADTIWIGDGTNEEFHTNVSIVKSGDQVTITLDSGDQIGNNYDDTNTVVSSIFDVGTIETTSDSWTISSVSGTYDDTTYPLVLDNIGTVEQDWTLTFTSATQFNCTGNTLGAVGTGDISTDYSPDNTDFTKPYFTLNHLGFGGTWAMGDIITFTTHPASQGIWFKRVIDPNTTSSANEFRHTLTGESA
jgi:hypothetical protein